MTLCPVALAVGCKKCPIFSICLVKCLIGNYKGSDEKPETAPLEEPPSETSRKEP